MFTVPFAGSFVYFGKENIRAIRCPRLFSAVELKMSTMD